MCSVLQCCALPSSSGSAHLPGVCEERTGLCGYWRLCVSRHQRGWCRRPRTHPLLDVVVIFLILSGLHLQGCGECKPKELCDMKKMCHSCCDDDAFDPDPACVNRSSLPAPLPEAENTVCHEYCDTTCPVVFDGSDPGACVAPAREAARNLTENTFGRVHRDKKRIVPRMKPSKKERSNTVCSAVLEHPNKACAKEIKEFNTVKTPLECLEQARNEAPCGDHIMWSPSYPGWGCRCCDREGGFVDHQYWQVMRLECQAASPAPRLRGQRRSDGDSADGDERPAGLDDSSAGQDGDPASSNESSGGNAGAEDADDDETKSCFWRQTGSCNENGPREPEHDQPCNAVIEPGKSGYCECSPDVRGFGTDCKGKFAFTCDIACGGPEICKWMQTGGCDPTGPREPHNDKPCNEVIQAGASGFCQCGPDQKRARLSTCSGQGSFTCLEACSQLLLAEADNEEPEAMEL